MVKREREGYRTVQIPKRLGELIEDFIDTEYRFPYRSLAEFVIESTRIRFYELKKEIEEIEKREEGKKVEEEEHGGKERN